MTLYKLGRGVEVTAVQGDRGEAAQRIRVPHHRLRQQPRVLILLPPAPDFRTTKDHLERRGRRADRECPLGLVEQCVGLDELAADSQYSRVVAAAEAKELVKPQPRGNAFLDRPAPLRGPRKIKGMFAAVDDEAAGEAGRQDGL